MTELKSPAPEKRKFALWISKDTIDRAKKSYKDDNCSSASEFIEKAILFYLGYLSSQENQDYLASIIPSTVKGIVDESANRMGRLLFKIAVEMAVVENILAAVCDVDELEVTRLRGQCVKEIKSTNGLLSFEEALRWQRDG
ncbi:MAG: hypothetical protein ACLTEG_03875 [Acutalibacter sp.]